MKDIHYEPFHDVLKISRIDSDQGTNCSLDKPLVGSASQELLTGSLQINMSRTGSNQVTVNLKELPQYKYGKVILMGV